MSAKTILDETRATLDDTKARLDAMLRARPAAPLVHEPWTEMGEEPPAAPPVEVEPAPKPAPMPPSFAEVVKRHAAAPPPPPAMSFLSRMRGAAPAPTPPAAPLSPATSAYLSGIDAEQEFVENVAPFKPGALLILGVGIGGAAVLSEVTRQAQHQDRLAAIGPAARYVAEAEGDPEEQAARAEEVRDALALDQASDAELAEVETVAGEEVALIQAEREYAAERARAAEEAERARVDQLEGATRAAELATATALSAAQVAAAGAQVSAASIHAQAVDREIATQERAEERAEERRATRRAERRQEAAEHDAARVAAFAAPPHEDSGEAVASAIDRVLREVDE